MENQQRVRTGSRSGATGAGIIGIVALSAWGLTDAARADGFYFGGGVGKSEFFTDQSPCGELLEEAEEEVAEQQGGGDLLVAESFARFVAGAECRDDETDSATKVFIGYRYNPYVALELGYNDFGKATADFSSSISDVVGTLEGGGRISVSAEAISLSGLFGFPVGERVNLFARLGISGWEAEARGEAFGTFRQAGGRTVTRTETFALDDSDVDVNYGAGARFAITDHIALRAEYEHFEVTDIDVISASIEISPGG
jgi:opacity protein-like surface antigen